MSHPKSRSLGEICGLHQDAINFFPLLKKAKKKTVCEKHLQKILTVRYPCGYVNNNTVGLDY